MPQPVNLMRWREARRRKLLRFWGLMFSAPVLFSLMLLLIGRMVESQDTALHAIYVRSDAQLFQRLTQREQQLNAEQVQRERLVRRQQQREQTLSWQSDLNTLAEQLPENVWLTALEWQGEVLSLRGLVEQINALPALENTLKKLPRFHSFSAGATRRDDQGRWQFSYQLYGERTNAGVR